MSIGGRLGRFQVALYTAAALSRLRLPCPALTRTRTGGLWILEGFPASLRPRHGRFRLSPGRGTASLDTHRGYV